jgi:hypothetical protein
MMRMKVIPEWRQAWRLLSVQVASAAVLFGALPAETQAAVLDLVGLPPSRLPAVLGLVMIAGRLWAQPGMRR